ncbi:type III secretion system chaperone [Lawsonia intracellularis]|uniref:NA n=1 Tax=Lawsonia intracellularis (strain PHE/MN1-00) TaxID=363253 RepID=Q1MSD0_LAWIP|nr:type III secretion system chaperone [Lawsonia intracellularis]AGC49439.1 type III secretion chaperone, CesT family [Lawsonia intracellularis N343]KAA0204955.1 Tir chaperone family protein [Lawsonia intracellularis]MBZ3893152.1 type III secretion system chaperone [Lawsonia intracellularis]OMQ06100.1 Tir chaperone family protein [Lawsonia intracellularis]RBN32496.1 Tir chaperone family protein [Lawsonia intracellularis]
MVATDVIKDLGQELNIPGLEFDQNLVCSFSVHNGNLDMTIETNETGDLVYVCGYLGIMPDDNNAAAAVAILFAQANSTLSSMNRGVLALDYNGERLLFSKLYNVSHWEPNECIESILQLIEDAEEWKHRLYQPDFGLSELTKGGINKTENNNSFLKV